MIISRRRAARGTGNGGPRIRATARFGTQPATRNARNRSFADREVEEQVQAAFEGSMLSAVSPNDHAFGIHVLSSNGERGTPDWRWIARSAPMRNSR